MKLFITQAATALALYNEVTFDGQLDNAVELKSEHFDDHGVHMIDAITSAIVGGAINDDIMDILDDACDHCRAEPPTLSSVQNLLIFPDISADQGGFSQEKLNVFMSNICGAVTCRDKVAQCADMISRQMDCSSNWMQANCANSCGCQPKAPCPPIMTEDVIEAVIEEDQNEDAEHNDALMQDISIADALRLLDPTTTLGQFDTDVRATLQTQMCQTENADARIVAANDLLRVLVDPEMARVMNYISQKLPMYLSGLPDATKNILANEVICGGFKRSVSAESCLDTMLVAEKLVCDERAPRWTYNRMTGQCTKSMYDGCFLTQNRFMTQAACENKCQFHIKAAMKVNERKLENFITALRPENLRDSLLGMFGKQPNATDSTEDLLAAACDPKTGKVSEPYRERLCERLYQLSDKMDAVTTPSPVTQRLVGVDPVVMVESICPADNVDRKFCTRRPAGRMSTWQAACESAGCCFDRSPSGPRSKLLWKDFCFQKIEKRTVVTHEIKQVDETDEEHQSTESINCNVPVGSRHFCAARQGGSINQIRENCEAAGCCFKLNGNRLFGKWKQSCYQPGN